MGVTAIAINAAAVTEDCGLGFVDDLGGYSTGMMPVCMATPADGGIEAQGAFADAFDVAPD
eukprot:5229166-Pleurochrysis_carterae.AAC.1